MKKIIKSINCIVRLSQRIFPRRFQAILRSTFSKVTAPLECPQTKALRDFVQPYFEATSYLGSNEDVRRSGTDPLMHWLGYGIWEGRSGLSALEVVVDLELDEAYGWRQFNIGERSICVRIKSDRSVILNQIMEQFRFDPTVLAAGAHALKNFRSIRGDDILAREGIKVSVLYDGLPDTVGVMVATPLLVAGGAEKYIVDLVNTLDELGYGPVVVVVTDQTRQQAQGWSQLKILAPLQNHFVKFWSDAVKPDHGRSDHFACFVQSLRPRLLVANNSRLALDAISKFGRGLSQHSRLYCTYFSLSPFGLGAPWSARYATWTCQYAKSITDNEVMHATLREMTGAIPGTQVAIVPPLAPVLTRDFFDKRLTARSSRSSPARQRRWAWVSRVDTAKGTQILRQIALKLPSDRFDVFGPLSPCSHVGDELTAPNIQLCGLIHDVTSADFTAYDGFLFTSIFEGMPNVVLEMTQHAIPLVLADVGGLSYTFTDGSALFVQHSETLQTTVDNFVAALDRLAAMPLEDIQRMVSYAYERVEARHGLVAHRTAVRALLEKEVE